MPYGSPSPAPTRSSSPVALSHDHAPSLTSKSVVAPFCSSFVKEKKPSEDQLKLTTKNDSERIDPITRPSTELTNQMFNTNNEVEIGLTSLKEVAAWQTDNKISSFNKLRSLTS